MFYYKTIIQYEGTNYAGFQWQNGMQTVQSEFNLALSQIVSSKVTTMPASRTDTGVHALDQVVKISSEDEIDCSSFLDFFNKALPSDIRCIEIQECEGLFKPSVDSISKEYRYFFTNNTLVSKEDTQFIANISNNLNINAMMTCIEALIGKHDFCNFYSSGSNVKSTIRDISFCELSIINPHEVFNEFDLFKISKNINQCYQLRIEANGFLKQMIRHIVSGLWMVGSGKLSTLDFIHLIDGPKNPRQLWKVAAPNGLFLYKITY